MSPKLLQQPLQAAQSMFASQQSQAYTAINEKSSTDGLLEDSEHDSGSLYLRPTPTKSRWRQTVMITLLVMTNFFMAMALLLSSRGFSDREASRQVSVWSPLNDLVEYKERDFVNPFAHDTIYRGPTSVQLEEAWEDLWFFDGVRIPEDKLPFLNRSADLGGSRSLKPVEDEEGGFHSMFEFFHQLHCLNLIRQYTWKDWYFRHPDIVRTPADLRAGDVGARMHVDHCIEALRISLMCNADTTPYLIINDPTAPFGTRADFSPHHKCRKLEPIRDWVSKNQLGNPKIPGMWKPESETHPEHPEHPHGHAGM